MADFTRSLRPFATANLSSDHDSPLSGTLKPDNDQRAQSAALHPRSVFPKKKLGKSDQKSFIVPDFARSQPECPITSPFRILLARAPSHHQIITASTKGTICPIDTGVGMVSSALLGKKTETSDFGKPEIARAKRTALCTENSLLKKHPETPRPHVLPGKQTRAF